MKNNNIILIDQPAQIETIKPLLKLNNIILALSPAVMYTLDKLNISYHIPEDYFDKKELGKKGIKSFKLFDKLVDILDKNIQDKIPFFKKENINPFKYNYCELKRFYDYFWLRIFYLEKVITKFKPEVIYCFKNHSLSFSSNDFSIYSYLLKKVYSRKFKIKLLPYSKPPSENHSKKKPSNNIKYILSFQRIYQKIINSIFLFFHNQGNIICFNPNYSWDTLVPYLKKYYKIHFYNFSPEPGNTYIERKLYKNISANKKLFASIFTIKPALDYQDIFFKQLSLYMDNNYFENIISHYKNLSKLFNKFKFKYFIKNFNTEPIVNIINNLAFTYKTKRITYQHGAHGHIGHTIMEKVDFLPNEKYFIFGKGEYNYFQNKIKNLSSKLVITGNLENNFKKRNIQNKISKVLYVTTNYENNRTYFKGEKWNLYDRTLWQTQKTILTKLKSIQNQFNFQLIFKLHPGNSIKDEHLFHFFNDLKFNFDSQIIKKEAFFQDLIYIADIIIIDVPSTTLLYASEYKKPIFVSTELLLPESAARKKLTESNIIHSSSTSLLMNNFKKLLLSNKLPLCKNYFCQYFFRPWNIRTRISKALAEFDIQ